MCETQIYFICYLYKEIEFVKIQEEPSQISQFQDNIGDEEQFFHQDIDSSRDEPFNIQNRQLAISTGLSINNNEEMLVHHPIRFRETLLDLTRFAAPFSLGRVVIAVQIIGNAVIMRFIGTNAVAAGPLIIGFQFCVMGTTRACVLGTGTILIPELIEHGEMHSVGRVANQSLILGSLLSIPALAVLLSSGSLLELIGVSQDISSEVSKYFFGFAIGVPPLLWSMADQQLALGIGRTNVSLVTSIFFTIISLGLSTGAVFGLDWGIFGVSFGCSISAIVTLIGLRVYYAIDPEYQRLDLFAIRGITQNLKENMKKMLALGLSMALQSFAEWGNLTIISVLISLISTQALIAEQVSLQWMSTVNLMTLGLSLATSARIGRTRTLRDLALMNNNTREAREKQKLLKQYLAAGGLLVAGTSIIASGLFAGIPNALTDVFVQRSSYSGDYEQLLTESKSLLFINAFGIFLDAIRFILTGVLMGLKDIFVPSLISFGMMTVVCLSLGAGLVEGLDLFVGTFFWTRNLGILLAIVGLVWRWSSQLKEVDVHIQEIDASAGVVETQENLGICARVSNCLSGFFYSRDGRRERLPQLATADEVGIYDTPAGTANPHEDVGICTRISNCLFDFFNNRNNQSEMLPLILTRSEVSTEGYSANRTRYETLN